MGRLRGPDMGSRSVYLPNGKPAAGRIGKVYLSPGGVLADILVDDGTETPGVAIPDSEITVDENGLLPTFWFPDGDVDRLYISVNGGPVTPIDADYNSRIDIRAKTVDIQSFTTPGAFVWDKPTGAKMVEVITIGGGGGGGSGRRGAALTVRCGGAGGGGGSVTRSLLMASELPASCPGVVGIGGLGGSSFTVPDNTNGNPGGGGGNTVFNDTIQGASSALRVRAGGGVGGNGGTNGGATGGTGGFAMFSGASGGAAHVSGGVGVNGGDTGGGPTGGASGGGITSADAVSNGGAGGVNGILDQSRAVGGVAPGGVGENGRSTLSMGPGNGGAGGASSITGAAGAGGLGGNYGGGGGGGGASLNGNSVGAGGKGGDGAVFVITYF